jgi:biotin operon repressor
MDEHLVDVMRNSDLSIGARLLWWELNQWVSEDLNVCFPTQVTLAESLGVSRTSVIRWIQELRDNGLVKLVPRRYGNGYELLRSASQNA